jgi:hypothetical protein
MKTNLVNKMVSVIKPGVEIISVGLIVGGMFISGVGILALSFRVSNGMKLKA